MSLSAALPAFIMFGVTSVMVGICLLPVLLRRKGSLIGFYWAGLWYMVALVAAVAGYGQVVLLAGIPAEPLIIILQTSITAAFVVFVVFAWFRLAGAAVLSGLRRIRVSV